MPAASVVPWLALAVIAFLLYSITLNEWAVVGGVLAAACVLYAATLPARRHGSGASVAVSWSSASISSTSRPA